MDERIEKTDEEWRAGLSDEQYRVTRQSGTEAPFSGKYWDTKTAGTYRCVCCETALFRSDTKFDSGCGWPSFYQATNADSIQEERDGTHGMTRTEVMCNKCGAHLGHVFEDGPQPTGLRYCINSLSIKMDEKS